MLTAFACMQSRQFTIQVSRLGFLMIGKKVATPTRRDLGDVMEIQSPMTSNAHCHHAARRLLGVGATALRPGNHAALKADDYNSVLGAMRRLGSAVQSANGREYGVQCWME